MATFSQSTIETCSDSFIDFCCSPCLEHKIDQSAELYCDTCQKFYCAECVTLHGQLFGKHVTYGRGDTSKWPASKEVQDFLLKCDLHEDKHLEMYCNNHSQLCCTNCAFLNHRLCTKVTLISESARGPLPDLQQLSRKIQTILEEVKKLENHWNTNMLTVQASYDKLLDEIRDTRQTINIILDKIEKNTIQELDDKMTSLKASIKTDLDNCIKLKNELKQLSGAINDIIDKGKAELTFIASKKCLEQVKQSETYLKENSVQVESSLTFQADSDVPQYLSKLSGLGKIVLSTKEIFVLGDPDQVFTVQGKSEYNVHLPSDSRICTIIAICVLSDDEILVADQDNKRVKLLNHQYQVVGHCDLTGYPMDMCKITPSEVAVAVKNFEVQFVSVNGGQLVKGRKLQFQHRCYGIAHNLQDLYLTSWKSLYKYSMNGTLLNKVYEDTSDKCTELKCAVSPSGDKIFVIHHSYEVLTLATDGTVLHTFTDPDLQKPYSIHVTDLGQVLVICGRSSKTIIQLDGEGKKKLATLASEWDGLAYPVSVYFYRSTASIIVGQTARNNILVFKVK
ncbi:transcription intermediary factor 1-alpha-like [Dreissena polymorpha]|uniref:B box-type domain-containing protein n=1 Tax=Dreissena polymorpha TaxID=45954 RepID=A0A9D4N767_DREPO|nr:transcription intermediary factor 1-alpha-like [Dreissena polymorpha]KAH3891018.1 hypothetical protein DPMN_015109 [Dreissena polymorpha]